MSGLNLNLLFDTDVNHTSPEHINSDHSDSAFSATRQASYSPGEDGEEIYTKAQWKSMSPKERRQLRNKISARNFRTRRKEYMTTIEVELNRNKLVAAKLQQQVDVYKTQNEELRAENSQLRLQVLVLSQRRSVSPAQQPPIPQQQQRWPMSGLLAVSNMQTPQLNRSTPPTSPPSTISEYDSTVPASRSPYQLELFNDMAPVNYNTYPIDQIYTYLSHTVVPSWNIEQVLLHQTISSQSTHDLFREYTLLAPALMSIIVRDTFVKNYQAFSKKSPMLLTAPSSTALVQHNPSPTKLNFSARKGIENLSYKELKLIWNLLQSGMQRKDQIGVDQPDEDASEETQAAKFLLGARTWLWMKQNVCSVVTSYVSMYANALKPSS
jgi:hypothetical protein